MKTFFLTMVLPIAFSYLSLSQVVTGKVTDENKFPLSGASITLLEATDSSIVKLDISRDSGLFKFHDLISGDYFLTISYIGYQPYASSVFSAGNDITIPDIRLHKLSGALTAVVVTSKKQLLEVKADKIIMNVENSINAIGNSALELLRKSPGIMLDKDDNITMNSKNGVRIYIDGRITPLSGQDLVAYLRALSSSQIEAIELITNPSAKYEAAGNAGIINIRLKKNKSMGTNGSLNAGLYIGKYLKYNTGWNLNYRNEKINVFGNYAYDGGGNEKQISLTRTVSDSSFNQSGRMNWNNSSHNLKVGADYFINTSHTVGLIINAGISKPDIFNQSRTVISNVPLQQINRILTSDNINLEKRENVSVNLNYMFNKGGNSLALNGDYGNYDIKGEQYQPNVYYDASGNLIPGAPNYLMIAPNKINIYSLKTDYEQDFRKGKLSLGGKVAYINTNNNFQRYNVFSSYKELDKDRSNSFNYDENINSLYSNFTRTFSGFQLQAGLRVENTIVEGTSEGLRQVNGSYVDYDSTFNRTYTGLFPSAAITFNKNPESQFTFTYSRRIDRPAYQDLNPFEFKVDEYFFQKGNINLLPQFTHSIGVTHSYKSTLTTTLNYSSVNDLFTSILDTIETSKAIITQRNIGHQDVISLNISYPFRYKRYSMYANVSGNYSIYKSDFGTGRQIKEDAFGLNVFVQNNLKFGKNWTAELSGFYTAPTLTQSILRSRSLWSVDAGIQTQVLKDRATVKFAVTDVFKSLTFIGRSYFAGQNAEYRTNWESRQGKLSFLYRFGSSTIKSARNRTSGASEELKRVK